MKAERKEILITGAGPTGLTLANLLARMDVPFVLIDRNKGPSRDSKAFGIHARTLEIFDLLGIANKAVKEGNIDNTIHIYIKDREEVNLRIRELLPGETAYPYFLILEQNETERLLIKSLENYDAKVHWEHELKDLKEVDHGVEVDIGSPSGNQRSQFQYVIGCDGADSTVRSKGGFSFKGKTFSSTFYLADGNIQGNLQHGDIYFMIAPKYITGIFSFREKDKFRVFNFMNPAVEKQDQLTSEDVQKILSSNPYKVLEAKKVDWTSVFKIHVRNAGQFRKGRILLVGDAAHVHSPAGGQGMNTGIQDAFNLAWKLALVAKGRVHPRLLSTYHEERYPIAKNLHRTTDRFFDVIITKNKLGDLFRFYLFPVVLKVIFGIKSFQKDNLRRLSQLAIKYRDSSLSKQGTVKGLSRRAPKAGDRVPYCELDIEGSKKGIFDLFSCNRFTLLVAVTEVRNKKIQEILTYFSNEIGLPVEVHVIDITAAEKDFCHIYGVKKEALFLIRPDNHIAFRSSRIDPGEIRSYCQNVLRVKNRNEGYFI